MTPTRHRTLATIRACDPAPISAPHPGYFVVMIDHGRRSREAVVDPEMTRREVVSRILTLEYDPERIAFIHHVTSAGVEDVTFGIIAECARAALEGTEPMAAADRQAAAFDHARKLRVEA